MSAQPHVPDFDTDQDGDQDVDDLVSAARRDAAALARHGDPEWSYGTDVNERDDADRWWEHGTPAWAEVEYYRRQAEIEQAHEEALELATAERATGDVDLGSGIRVVRTTGETDETDEADETAPDRFSDHDYDEYDALLDGPPRW